MARAVVLFVAAMAAAVLAGACGAAPQRVEVGEIKTQSRSVEVEGADSAKVNLRLAIGELDVGGGAAENRLMEADFAHNVAAWEPSVDYEVVGDSGELEVRQQGLTEGIPTPAVRNEWDVRLSDAVPVDLTVQMGGGVGNLDLDGLDLTGLNLDVGAGSTRVDLSGDWGRDLSAVVRGGAGEVTMLLPGRMGVRINAGTRLGRVNAEGLRKDGEAYVNGAYGDSDNTLEVDITGGVGQINLQLVQQEGPEAGAAQQERTTAQRGGGETTMQGGEKTTMMMGEGTEAVGDGGTTMTREETPAAGGGTTTEDAAVGPADIVEDPRRYYGRTTTVDGAVGQVIEPRAFVMVEGQKARDGAPSAAELAEGGVLVVRTGGPAPDITELDNVRATGTLQEFDITAFEQQQGVELDDALYGGYQDEPVLVAAEVQPVQNEGATP
jgi:hypothetical protein